MNDVMELSPKEEMPADLMQRVFLERLNIFYRSLSVSLAAVVVISLLVTYSLRTSQNSDTVFAWLAFMLLVVAYRVTMLLRFRGRSPEQLEASCRWWYKEVLIGASLSGLTWGAAGFLFFDPQNTLNQSVLAFSGAGICALSIVSMSAFGEAAAAFLALSLLPLCARLLTDSGDASEILALMVALYLIVMIAFAHRVNAMVVRGLEMSFLRSRAEETIERQAMFDHLTGLPNRRLLQDRLRQALTRARRHHHQAALLFMDLDFFKRVNDSLGHSVGDQLLVEIARRIQEVLRDEDTAARLGGDEFVALLTDIEGDRDHVVSVVRRRGEQIRKAIERPVNVGGNELHVTVSIGASLLPRDSDNVDDLLAHADTAMYRAKEDGRNTLRFFVTEMQDALAKRMDIEQQLRSALDGSAELELYLQPQYNEKLSICGAELLLRWNRNGSFIPPDTFIPVAEDSGLIYRLGDWVVEEACRIGEEILPLLEYEGFSLAFNVSPRQFRQKDFSQKLLAAMQGRGLRKGLMEMELTEGLLIDDVDDTVAKMQTLRDNGLRFSIDDFGTGYSSLRYLKSLPLDALKVDQSFVRDVLADPGDASIVRAIISMAQTLELEVIAEGVESAAIHDFLLGAGCGKFQGYYYAQPMPLVEFKTLLQRSAQLSAQSSVQSSEFPGGGRTTQVIGV